MSLAHDIKSGCRTGDVRISQNVKFDSMLLAPKILDGLKQSGFLTPSPIQLHGIPLGKCGFDLLLEAKSGTGKTAVFTVIALEKLDLKNGLQVVILAPTREIASQICDVIKQIGSGIEGLNVEVVMGGLPVQDDIDKFSKKNVHIVVGSPGRLRHLIQDKHIDVSAVRLLVLDEADKLVEKSFLQDINYIFSVLPDQKQIIMSSATYPETSKTFIDKYVQNAQHVCPDTNSILLGIEQKITSVKYNVNIVKQTQHRQEELLKMLSRKQFKQCLIFCNYQARVVELHKKLTQENWPAEQLYGQQEQTERLDALKTLQDYKCRILISTDLAARGIDASNVDLVINFEPPFEWQTYLHRIGRAGRFGSYGTAVTILSQGKEEKKFHDMLGPLRATISFMNFWDDDEQQSLQQAQLLVDNNSSNNGIETNGNSKVLDELWKIFTRESEEDAKCNIESFEELCKSFKDYKDGKKILENQENQIVENNEDDMHDIYEHWRTQIKSVEKYFKFFPRNLDGSLKNKENTVAENRHIETELGQKDTIVFENRDTAGSLKNKEKPVAVNGHLKTEMCKEGTLVFKNGDIAGSLKNKEKTVTENGHNETEICNKDTFVFKNEDTTENSHVIDNQLDADVTEALEKAGLPTAFSSSKGKGRNIKKNEKSKTKHEHGGEYKQKMKTKDNSINNKNRNTNNFDTWRLKYVQAEASEEVKPKFFNNVDDMPATSIKDDNINLDKKVAPNNARTDEEIYYNWYSQLKFKVKQFELAVYLEEMSKL